MAFVSLRKIISKITQELSKQGWMTTFFSLLVLFLTACSESNSQLTPLLPNDVIMAFGDSITYGTGATQETNYPTQLEKIIKHKVINAGVPGEETRDSLKRISKLLDQYQPKLVIVCLGGNDLIRKRPTSEIKNNLHQILQIIKNHGSQVVLIGVPRVSHNLEVPMLYTELGNELNIPVDTVSYGELISQSKYKSDYIHLNALGYQLFAANIAALLKEKGALGN